MMLWTEIHFKHKGRSEHAFGKGSYNLLQGCINQ